MGSTGRRDFLGVAGASMAVILTGKLARKSSQRPSPENFDADDQIDPWIELDMDALASNVREVRRRIGDRPIMAVVKCNAYGHGDVEIATDGHGVRISLQELSARWDRARNLSTRSVDEHSARSHTRVGGSLGTEVDYQYRAEHVHFEKTQHWRRGVTIIQDTLRRAVRFDLGWDADAFKFSHRSTERVWRGAAKISNQEVRGLRRIIGDADVAVVLPIQTAKVSGEVSTVGRGKRLLCGHDGTDIAHAPGRAGRHPRLEKRRDNDRGQHEHERGENDTPGSTRAGRFSDGLGTVWFLPHGLELPLKRLVTPRRCDRLGIIQGRAARLPRDKEEEHGHQQPRLRATFGVVVVPRIDTNRRCK